MSSIDGWFSYVDMTYLWGSMLFRGRQGYRWHHCPRRPDKQPPPDSPTLTLLADPSLSISAATWPDVDAGISIVCFLCAVVVIWHMFFVWELLSVFLHRAADWQNIVPRRNCCLIYCLLSESWRYTRLETRRLIILFLLL